VLFAVAALAGGLVLLSIGAHDRVRPAADTPRAAYVIPLVLASGAVALRRAATRTGLAVGTGAALLDLALGGSLATMLVYTQVLYDACVYGPPRLWRALVRIAVATTVVGALAGVAAARAWVGISVGVLLALVVLLPVLTGVSVRQYRDQAATERIRAEQTARLAELDRRRAVQAERTRMARELHDVVANHLSAVAIHATAALSSRTDDRGVRQALGVIRASGVQGLAEMRRMIDLLRDDDGSAADDGPGPDAAVSPGLDDAEALVARARAAGLAVSVRVDGEPRRLPVGVDLAAYRILQESLTNALKHGGGSADVTLGYGDGRLLVTVDNPVSDGGRHAVPVPGAGAGLVGMRERADLLAGSLAAGPGGAGWRVRAELPTGPP